MNYKSLLLVAAMVGFAGVACADAETDFVFFDAQIAALQHRVDTSASSGADHEAVTAMQGKQQELANQEAKLKAAGTLTADEKNALSFSIREQQQRIASLTQAAAPAMRHVDPASVPAQTLVTPNGTTVSGPAGSGVVVSRPNVAAPTVAAPTVPVVHSPTPAQNEQPAQ